MEKCLNKMTIEVLIIMKVKKSNLIHPSLIIKIRNKICKNT